MKYTLCGIGGLVMSASVAGVEVVTFDYGKPNSGSMAYVDAEAGDAIKVQVLQTCETFVVSYRGHRAVAPESSDARYGILKGGGGEACDDSGSHLTMLPDL